MQVISERHLREEAFQLFGRLIVRSDPGRLEEWAALGLTMTQLRVLFILRGEPGLPAGSLAERLAVTPSTLTRIMDRLVRNGLIQRDPDEVDRRLVRHSLTPRGSEVLAAMERAGRARINDIFGRLDERELERVVEALRLLSAAVDAADSDASRMGE
jgi:DNA-binding MarR family transcriptional regulator